MARFGRPEQAEFGHGQRRTADSLVATIATRAGVLVMPEPERAATLGRIRAFLTSGPDTGHGEFTRVPEVGWCQAVEGLAASFVVTSLGVAGP